MISVKEWIHSENFIEKRKLFAGRAAGGVRAHSSSPCLFCFHKGEFIMAEEEKKTPPSDAPKDDTERIGVKAYIALAVAVAYFSGALADVEGMKWLAAFDFTSLSGSFGKIKEGGNFLGTAGIGARQGFLFALSLTPAVMLALGCLEILAHYGALKAAQKLLTPLLRPLLGIPGATGLALITDLQSTDAGAALTRELYEDKIVTKKELIIMSAWQYSGAGMVNNYFTIGAGAFAFLIAPLFIPFILIFIFKFVGAIFVRFMLNTVYKGDFEDE